MNTFNSQRSYQIAPASLSNPNYKLVQAQSKVLKCAGYIKILAWFFIITGIISALTGLGSIDEDHEFSIDFDDLPMEAEDLDVPEGIRVVSGILLFLKGLLGVFLGFLCLKVAKNPTRKNTWRLFKKTILIVIFKLLLATLAFIIISAGYGIAFGEWVEKNETFSEDPRFKNMNENSDFILTQDQGKELANFFEAGMVILFSLMLPFAFICCCTILFSSCILGGLYKFHTDAKEFDIIYECSFYNQGNYQQFMYQAQHVQPVAQNEDPPQNFGQYPVPSAPFTTNQTHTLAENPQTFRTNVTRGHVVMMSQTQQ